MVPHCCTSYGFSKLTGSIYFNRTEILLGIFCSQREPIIFPVMGLVFLCIIFDISAKSMYKPIVFNLEIFYTHVVVNVIRVQESRNPDLYFYGTFFIQRCRTLVKTLSRFTLFILNSELFYL